MRRSLVAEAEGSDMSQPRVTPASLATFLRPDRTVSFWDQMAAQPRARTVRICPPPYRSASEIAPSCSTSQAVRQLDTGTPIDGDVEPRKRKYSRRTFEQVRADALRGAGHA